MPINGLKGIKTVNKILLFVAFCLLFSCEKQGLIVYCPDCTAEEPEMAQLQIKVDINQYGSATIITVYEGNLEDGIVYKTIQSGGKEATVSVTLNKKYTITATYYIPGNEYVAVNSVTPRVRYTKDQCDDPCYYVYDRVVNLRLKYTK